NKTSGIDIEDKAEKEKIYQKYLEAFKKGAYNYIKEDYDPYMKQMVPRKYFSGGFSADDEAALIEDGGVVDVRRGDAARRDQEEALAGGGSKVTVSAYLQQFVGGEGGAHANLNRSVEGVLDQIAAQLGISRGADGRYDFSGAVRVAAEGALRWEVDGSPDAGNMFINEQGKLVVIDPRFEGMDHAGLGTYGLMVFAANDAMRVHEETEQDFILNGLQRLEIIAATDVGTPAVRQKLRAHANWDGRAETRATALERQNTLVRLRHEAHDAASQAEARESGGRPYVPEELVLLSAPLREFDLMIAGGAGAPSTFKKDDLVEVILDGSTGTVLSVSSMSMGGQTIVMVEVDFTVGPKAGTKAKLMAAKLRIVGTGAAEADYTGVEPQLQGGKKDVLARAYRNLLLNEHVTQESRNRRDVLAKIGPQVEQFVRNRLRNQRIKIAIAPVGSSLNGYASATSDVEYMLYIVDGLGNEVLRYDRNDQEFLDIVAEVGRLLAAEGYEVDGQRDIAMEINNFSGLNQRMPELPDQAMSGGSLAIAEYFHPLFIPIVYGDGVLVARARYNLVNGIEEVDWQAIQELYWDRIARIVEDNVGTKPHLAEWLRAQGVDTGAVSAVRHFNEQRRRQVSLPGYSQTAQIALAGIIALARGTRRTGDEAILVADGGGDRWPTTTKVLSDSLNQNFAEADRAIQESRWADVRRHLDQAVETLARVDLTSGGVDGEEALVDLLNPEGRMPENIATVNSIIDGYFQHMSSEGGVPVWLASPFIYRVLLSRIRAFDSVAEAQPVLRNLLDRTVQSRAHLSRLGLNFDHLEPPRAVEISSGDEGRRSSESYSEYQNRMADKIQGLAQRLQTSVAIHVMPSQGVPSITESRFEANTYTVDPSRVKRMVTDRESALEFLEEFTRRFQSSLLSYGLQTKKGVASLPVALFIDKGDISQEDTLPQELFPNLHASLFFEGEGQFEGRLFGVVQWDFDTLDGINAQYLGQLLAERYIDLLLEIANRQSGGGVRAVSKDTALVGAGGEKTTQVVG
ncbi:MAG: hypothetical protein NUV91_08055, partial [Candidatus Omnitrophica bacterium]|nr:hypothetical protein [Candidatus Omnitrophota bacterium]